MPRNPLIDVLRGFAIFLMVFGHCIQYLFAWPPGEEGFFLNPVYALIYSFHMPLFMVVSGYLFYLSQKSKDFRVMVEKQVKSLLIPVAAWGVAVSFFTWKGGLGSLETMEGWKNLAFVVVRSILRDYWFLWAVFYNSITVIFIRRFFGDRLLAYILLGCVLFITPDGLGFSMYKFMYPYFVGAYLYHREKENGRLAAPIGRRVFILSAFVWMIGVMFWSRSSYIYTSGFTLLGKEPLLQASIDGYRWIVGLAGCVCLIWLFRTLSLCPKIWACCRMLLTAPGKSSLGIYLISVYVIDAAADAGLLLHSMNYPILAAEAAAICVLCIGLTQCFQSVRWLRLAFLGGR